MAWGRATRAGFNPAGLTPAEPGGITDAPVADRPSPLGAEFTFGDGLRVPWQVSGKASIKEA
jgi:hypothetical protein